ncbi:MAG: hypothetical protein L0170_15195, partial [Acidobacteria bacterium]|nr:hypothetical protein [Acidobacteriota bacterium]
MPASFAAPKYILLMMVGAFVAAGSSAVSLFPPDATPVEWEYENYDIRVHGRATLPHLEEAYGPRAMASMRGTGHKATAAMGPAQESARRASPGLGFRPSELIGGVEIVRSGSGFLMEPTGGSPTATVLTFLRRHGQAYGLGAKQVADLEVVGESLSRSSGIKMVVLRQRVNRLPVFQSQVRAVLDPKGRLVRTVGRLASGLDDLVVPPAGSLIAPEAALRNALSSVGIDVDVARLHSRAVVDEAGPVEVLSDDPLFLRPVRSEKVYFPLAPGVAVPAWAQATILRGFRVWYTVVDGRTGTLLFRKNLRSEGATSKQNARFSVYADASGHPLEGPAPGSPNNLLPGSGTQFPAVARTIVSMHAVRDPIASPKGWISDRDRTTTGNNVDAFLSRNGDLIPDLNLLDDEGRAMGNPDASGRNRDFLGTSPRDYSYTPAPTGSDPDAGDDPST